MFQQCLVLSFEVAGPHSGALVCGQGLGLIVDLVRIPSFSCYGVTESPAEGCTESSWKKLCLISEGGVRRITKTGS